MNPRKSWIRACALPLAGLLGLVAVGSPIGRPAAAATAGAGEPVVYEVTAVDGKLVRVRAAEEERLAVGARAVGGDELATGWFSGAALEARREAASFRLRSRTRVRLAADRPGVLLVLEKGRLRAIFDRLTGDEERERRIETPSAVLAVRGTEYGVAVGRNGATTLVVFEGTVEVAGLEPASAPVRVTAGEALFVRRGEPAGTPQPHGLSRRGWDRGESPALGPGPAGAGPGSPAGQGPPRGASSRLQGPPAGPPPGAPPASD